MEIGIADLQRDLEEAFAQGLRQKLGDERGSILRGVISYYPRVKLDKTQLTKILESEAGPFLEAVVANRADGPTMHTIRSQLIGSALLADKEAVIRWATEGLNRCRRVKGTWSDTAAQWQSALRDPDHLILYARQIKYFMNQL